LKISRQKLLQLSRHKGFGTAHLACPSGLKKGIGWHLPMTRPLLFISARKTYTAYALIAPSLLVGGRHKQQTGKAWCLSCSAPDLMTAPAGQPSNAHRSGLHRWPDAHTVQSCPTGHTVCHIPKRLFIAHSPNRSTKLSAALLPSGSWSFHWLLLFQKASHLCHMLTDLCMLQS